MSTINDGGPAFPLYDHHGDGQPFLAETGMSLRDHFATHCGALGDEVSMVLAAELAATQGVAKPADSKDLMGWHRFWCAANAAHRYMMADAMLAARASGTPAFDPVFMQRVDGIGDGDLCLTVRSQNCLKGAGIYLVGDLVQRSERDILVLQSMGRKSVHEIKEALAGLGLTLGMKLDNWPKGRRVDQG